jgi:hypothetical protein
MTRMRMIFGLAATVGVLASAAVAAVPAVAAEFVASGTKAPELKGQAVGNQEFAFNKIRVNCKGASVKGSVTSPETLNLVVKYKECTTGPVSWWGKNKNEEGKPLEVGMKLKEKAEYTYHINGWVESSEEIEMKAQFAKCLVAWEPGTYPEAALEKPERTYNEAAFSNQEISLGSGTYKLLITNTFKGLEWSEEGGGLCEDVELLEGEKGKVNGQLEVEVPRGSINIQ